MRTNVVQRVLTIATAMVALLLIAGVVSAKKPAQGEYLFTGQADYIYDSCDPDADFYGGGPFHDCGGGLFLCEVAAAHIDTKTFFDRDGNPVRYTEKAKGAGAFYELGEPANNLEYEPFHYTFFEDFGDDNVPFSGDDTYSFRGLFFKIKVPGYGIIFRDIGNIILAADFSTVVFQAGPHEYWNGELDAVCDVLTN